MGTAVANTVAKVVNAESESIALVFSALIGAIAWNYATWYVGMPSSSSHAIIGGLVGAGLCAGGLAAINWTAGGGDRGRDIASPLVAFTIACLAMFLVAGWQRLSGWHDTKPFKVLQLFSAAAVSFGHGANDAQKTMGLIAALLVGSGHAQAGADGKIPIATWIPIAAYEVDLARHRLGRLEDHRDDGPEDHDVARQLRPGREHRGDYGHLRCDRVRHPGLDHACGCLVRDGVRHPIREAAST